MNFLGLDLTTLGRWHSKQRQQQHFSSYTEYPAKHIWPKAPIKTIEAEKKIRIESTYLYSCRESILQETRRVEGDRCTLNLPKFIHGSGVIDKKEDDKAHFWLNGYVNKQNCRIWSEANPQVYVETPLHPEKLTVRCALWAGGILLQKR
ncbi:hypothetical protein TNCV_3167021 [Trichonephila clavipes]|uniref:Uncharacterized protein n=1 Tax=Trichonephila clavipes TaxID=2585209 RepID=A0A8X6USI7_TRICX|nr:hypothetical protein TNCV_3167021 [Trichonephila clavipes]